MLCLMVFLAGCVSLTTQSRQVSPWGTPERWRNGLECSIAPAGWIGDGYHLNGASLSVVGELTECRGVVCSLFPYTEALTGCQVSGMSVVGPSRGLLVGVVGNVFGATFSGVQCAFLFNLDVDVSETDLSGVQLACMNTAHGVTGVQLGLLNFTDELCGLQFGLLNFKEGAFPLPFLRLSF